MPDSLKSIIARNLKLLRAARGYTQEKLAERAELSKNYITEIETGRKYPAKEKFQILAAALDVEPWMLIYPRLSSWLEAERSSDPGVMEVLERIVPPSTPNRDFYLRLGEFVRETTASERPKPDKHSR